jgi:hypothetical protein
MEAVITYTKGYPNKTKLTYRRIEDNVVERIVNDFNFEIKQENERETKNERKKKRRKLVIV